MFSPDAADMAGDMYDDEVTVLVEKATSPMLFAADWEVNLACVDAILANDDGPEVAVDAIREKFESENENVIVLALEVRTASLWFSLTVLRVDTFSTATPSNSHKI
jgi:hypothetical protein